MSGSSSEDKVCFEETLQFVLIKLFDKVLILQD